MNSKRRISFQVNKYETQLPSHEETMSNRLKYSKYQLLVPNFKYKNCISTLMMLKYCILFVKSLKIKIMNFIGFKFNTI